MPSISFKELNTKPFSDTKILTEGRGVSAILAEIESLARNAGSAVGPGRVEIDMVAVLEAIRSAAADASKKLYEISGKL